MFSTGNLKYYSQFFLRQSLLGQPQKKHGTEEFAMGRWITYLSWILIAVIVGIEAGSPYLVQFKGIGNLPTPGLGIAALALVDGMLLYSWSTIKIGFFLPEKILTPAIKISNFVFFLLLGLCSLLSIGKAIALLSLMISLLLAVPFGTIAYMAKYADFPTGSAQAVLAAIFFLKAVFAASLIVGEKRLFEDYRVFLLLLLFSFLNNILLGFLHALVPGFLTSITDAVGAIVLAVVALVWLLIMFLGSLWHVLTLILDILTFALKGIRRPAKP